jgi:hypothetical protein
MRLGINYIDKLNFLFIYPQAGVDAYKPDNSFRAIGLVPINTPKVLLKLNI